jgi:hypothetical protein
MSKQTTDYKASRFGFSTIDKSMNPHMRGTVGFIDKPITYDQDKAHRLWTLFHDIDWDGVVPSHDQVRTALKKVKWTDLEPSLFYTLDCLEIFEQSGCKAPKAWGARQILRTSLVLGPDFFTLYKDARKDGYKKGINAFDPESLDSFLMNGEKTSDFWSGPDSWFDMRFSIFWELKSEDLAYSFYEGVGYTDDAVLSELVRTVSDMFEGQKVEELPLVGLYESSSSKALNTSDLDKTVPEWLLTYKNPEYDQASADFFVKEVQIPKCPGETRDGAVVSPSTKKALKQVNMAIMLLLKDNKHAKTRTPMCMNSEEFDHQLDQMSRFYYWYCRDYEKIGLSLPFTVICAVLQGLYNATGYEPFWEGQKFFSNPKVYTLEKEILSTVRGFFLGMFNEGMTIVQLALDVMVRDKMDSYSRPRALVLNDDSVFGFRHLNVLKEYVEEDRTLSLALNIPWKEAKSFASSEGFVFCEEYYLFDEKEEKTLLPKYAIQRAYYMPTIRRAKQLVNAIARCWDLDTSTIRNVMAFWGWEFYEEETSKPYELGGWLPFISDGFNLALRMSEWTTQESSALYAVDSYVKPKGTVGITPTTTLGRIINAYNVDKLQRLNTAEEFDLSDLFGDKTSLGNKRMMSITGKDRSQYYFLQEQRDVLKKYRWAVRNRNLIDIDTEEHYVKKGYLPSDYEMGKRGERLTEFINYATDKCMSDTRESNVRLAYILRKNGIACCHKLLDYSLLEAEALLCQNFAAKEHFGYLRKDLSMPKFEPSYYKVIKYCMNNFGEAPIYDNENCDYKYFMSMVFDGVPVSDYHIEKLMSYQDRFGSTQEFISWLLKVSIQCDDIYQEALNKRNAPLEEPSVCDQDDPADSIMDSVAIVAIKPLNREYVTRDEHGVVLGERIMVRVPRSSIPIIKQVLFGMGLYTADPEVDSSSDSDDMVGGLAFGEDCDY